MNVIRTSSRTALINGISLVNVDEPSLLHIDGAECANRRPASGLPAGHTQP